MRPSRNEEPDAVGAAPGLSNVIYLVSVVR